MHEHLCKGAAAGQQLAQGRQRERSRGRVAARFNAFRNFLLSMAGSHAKPADPAQGEQSAGPQQELQDTSAEQQDGDFTDLQPEEAAAKKAALLPETWVLNLQTHA